MQPRLQKRGLFIRGGTVGIYQVGGLGDELLAPLEDLVRVRAGVRVGVRVGVRELGSGSGLGLGLGLGLG